MVVITITIWFDSPYSTLWLIDLIWLLSDSLFVCDSTLWLTFRLRPPWLFHEYDTSFLIDWILWIWTLTIILNHWLSPLPSSTSDIWWYVCIPYLNRLVDHEHPMHRYPHYYPILMMTLFLMITYLLSSIYPSTTSISLSFWLSLYDAFYWYWLFYRLINEYWVYWPIMVHDHRSIGTIPQ